MQSTQTKIKRLKGFILLLPVEEGTKAPIVKYRDRFVYNPHSFHVNDGEHQHVYILSHRFPAKGDTIMEIGSNAISTYTGLEDHEIDRGISGPLLKKHRVIEATTDPALDLPRLPEDLIVLITNSNWKLKQIFLVMDEGDVNDYTTSYFPATNPNSEIIYESVKDNWTREEVERLLLRFNHTTFGVSLDDLTDAEIVNWFNNEY